MGGIPREMEREPVPSIFGYGLFAGTPERNIRRFPLPHRAARYCKRCGAAREVTAKA